MSRALANDKQNILEYDTNKLYQNYINMIFDKVSVKQSHVLLASKIDTDLLISMNKIKYRPITHISNKNYNNMIHGTRFPQDMNRFVAQTFHRV